MESEDDDSVVDAEGGEPSIDIQKHRKLVAEVQSLGNEAKSRYKFQRSEVASHVSEFGLPSTTGRLSLNELVGDSSRLGLKKVLRRIEQKKHQPSAVLEPVLLKPEEEKQNRAVAYDKVKDELRKWDTVVWENRVAPTIHFPLEKPSLRMQSLKEYADDFTPATNMESEVMALLNEGRDLSQFRKSRSEEFQMRKRALEEIRVRRAELIRQRMKVAYEARKNKHRNRIKSRRFHQVLRREKIALEKKAEENATPEESAENLAEKLADLERKRIEERASLRHRSGGSKFADKQRTMARFDSGARVAVENMASLSKSLTEKRVTFEDDSKNPEKDADDQSSLDEGDESNVPVATNEKNPWFFAPGAKKATNEQEGVTVKNSEGVKTEYVKLATVVAAEQKDHAEFFDDDDSSSEDDNVVEVESEEEEVASASKKQPKTLSEAIGVVAGESNAEPVLTPALISEAPHNPAEQRLDVAAAFAEDDVVAEFVSEKEKLAKKEQPKDIDLSLPGWGGWTGPGVSAKAQQKKKERFVLKAQKIARKDDNIPHVIIKEAPKKASDLIAKHQPTTVPFPFTSARAYERSLRQPIGREWVPEVSRRELIKPRVETQIGAVIEPLNGESKSIKRKLEEVQKSLAADKAAKAKMSKRSAIRAKMGKGKKKKQKKENPSK